MKTYDLGDKVRITATFRDTTGSLVDPTTVQFQYMPALLGSITTLTYPTDVALVKDSTGNYHVDLDTTNYAGVWYWRFFSTGTGQGAAEGSFNVRPTNLAASLGAAASTSIVQSQVTTGVSTSPVAILPANTRGGIAMVFGSDGLGNEFADALFFARSAAGLSFGNLNTLGSPAARTYTVVSNRLALALGSGTYTIRAAQWQII